MSGRRLNRRLVLEASQAVADGAGGQGVIWVTLGTLWAEVTPGAGREGQGEEVILGLTACRIVVRGAPVGNPRRPVPGQRFAEGTRRFAILAVAEADAAGRHLTCFCREEVPA